uniref:Ectodysplasin-A receptor-associated adapter protein n=1 Tax=Paramormyrops kingsleyae TaxID=1676925 RepID=A0A3B3SBL0_9TELE
MASLKAFQEQTQIISEPVEDTDPSSFESKMSLKSTHPVQVTEPQPVTLQLTSMPPGYLTPSSERIQQLFKDLQCSNGSCEKCCCLAPPPKISDLMNDEDLLYTLRLKLDPSHCTIKNWKNFASRWGMTYDELVLLEHRTQGSAHSPTQEFLRRYNEKSVTELTELCRIYQRIDVLRVLQRWVENDWPSRWQKAH